jgi:hypothetical protein
LGLQKLLRISLLGAVAAFVTMLPSNAVSNMNGPELVSARAAAAKAAGKTEVTFPSLTNTYPVEAKGLTHAITEFTVVVGTSRKTQPVLLEDGAGIGTWYSVEIEQTIADHACTLCALLTFDKLPGGAKPASLLPVPAHSMVFVRRGGSMTVDGVQVTETEKDVATLTEGKKYLFVVDKSPAGIARLVLNDAGIFVVGEDGNTLTPLNKQGGGSTSFPTVSELKREAGK